MNAIGYNNGKSKPDNMQISTDDRFKLRENAFPYPYKHTLL